MINYDNVIIELNKMSSSWDYYFDMETIMSGDLDCLWHIVYLVDADEVKLEVFHECMFINDMEPEGESDIIGICINGIVSHLSNISDFHEVMVNKLYMLIY